MIVRPRKEGCYAIISGHRRKYAAERLGYKKFLDAMEATQCMPSLSQEIRIKKLSEAGKLTENEVEGINQPGI